MPLSAVRKMQKLLQARGAHATHPRRPRSTSAAGVGHDHSVPNGISRAVRPTEAGSTHRRSTPGVPTRCRSAADSQLNVRWQLAAAQCARLAPVHQHWHSPCHIAFAGTLALSV